MEKKRSGVYMLRNKVTLNFYIGSGKDIDRRIRDHLLELKKNIHFSPQIQEEYNTHGDESVEFFLVEACDPERNLLLERENYYIQELLPTYNVNKYAKGRTVIKLRGNKIVGRWPSIRECARDLGMHHNTIKKYLDGKVKKPLYVLKYDCK